MTAVITLRSNQPFASQRLLVSIETFVSQEEVISQESPRSWFTRSVEQTPVDGSVSSTFLAAS